MKRTALPSVIIALCSYLLIVAHAQPTNAPGAPGDKATWTNGNHQTIVVRVRFEPRQGPLNLYLYVDPAVDNSGLHDTADVSTEALVASQGNVFMAVGSSVLFGEKTCGFVGASDGVSDLRATGRL